MDDRKQGRMRRKSKKVNNEDPKIFNDDLE